MEESSSNVFCLVFSAKNIQKRKNIKIKSKTKTKKGIYLLFIYSSL